ncbi:MAG: hypothetical protein Q4G39_01030 [Brachymonas sp.]|nr:hypothetical protein [Brachymonas sp.]
MMRRHGLLLMSVTAALLYALATWQLLPRPRFEQQEGLKVRLPLIFQIWQAGGDRYLAANLNVIRSATVGAFIKDQTTFAVQATLLQDASLFNPRHEDNYYLAASILPWQGSVEEAQVVLQRASNTRTWDMMPPFFYAFNAAYFGAEYQLAGQWAEIAARRTGEPNSSALRMIAAKWHERGDDPVVAIEMIERLKKVQNNSQQVALLDVRIQRLRGLVTLREAAVIFGEKYGRSAVRLEELVDAGLVQHIPEDPLGIGYMLDEKGVPQLLVRQRA